MYFVRWKAPRPTSRQLARPLRFRLEFCALVGTHALTGDLGEACSEAEAKGLSLVICTDDPETAEAAFDTISPLAANRSLSRSLCRGAWETEPGRRARACACKGGCSRQTWSLGSGPSGPEKK